MESGCLRAVALLLAAAAPAVTRADTAAAEVAALLDFCSANPGMSYSDGTPICGDGELWENGARQWGNGDPCAGDGWYGVTCDAAGEHVTGMCALRLRSTCLVCRR